MAVEHPLQAGAEPDLIDDIFPYSLPPLIEFAEKWMEYIARNGDLCAIETRTITEITRYVKSIGFPIPDNDPFVGRHFNTTRADIHAGGRGDSRQDGNRRHRPVGQQVPGHQGQGRRCQADRHRPGPQVGPGAVQCSRPPDGRQRRGARAAGPHAPAGALCPVQAPHITGLVATGAGLFLVGFDGTSAQMTVRRNV